jgi:hypothetical protein
MDKVMGCRLTGRGPMPARDSSIFLCHVYIIQFVINIWFHVVSMTISESDGGETNNFLLSTPISFLYNCFDHNALIHEGVGVGWDGMG